MARYILAGAALCALVAVIGFAIPAVYLREVDPLAAALALAGAVTHIPAVIVLALGAKLA